MRSADASTTPSGFLGVRLTPEELERLDRFQRTQGLTTRSDAVRALVRAADRLAQGSVELPVTLEREIRTLAEYGYAGNQDAALAVVLNLGLAELTKTHGDRWAATVRQAKELAEASKARDETDRRAGERLER